MPLLGSLWNAQVISGCIQFGALGLIYRRYMKAFPACGTYVCLYDWCSATT